MKNTTVYFFLFLVSFSILNSCKNIFEDDLLIKMDKETFEKEYEEWKLQDIRNYQFTYEFFNDAGPIGPVKIIIKENELPVIENSNEYNDGIIVENIMEIYDFIKSTFNFIEQVENGTYNGPKIRILTLNIKYNKQYHYPTEVDFSEGYIENVDGGRYYTLKITEFIKIN
jgi:hypothetical protein